jgi:YesN/AraC family two-component response regulator
MGVTPSEFLRDIRIAKAKELLLIDLPVSIVAESVGYLDQFYFSKLFKKETGVSPKDYKKSVKNID